MTATLVDLAGRTLARVDLPMEMFPMGVVDRGLIVSGPGGLYVIGVDGAADRISTGTFVGATENRVVVSTCDERLQCGAEVLDGRGRRVVVRATDPPVGAVAAPDGRVAWVQPDPNGASNQVTVDGVPVLEAINPGPVGLAWSPNGRWLAIGAIGAIDGIHLIDTLGGRAPVALDGPRWAFTEDFLLGFA